ncbi:NAD-dependent dehydratase [Candidatus Woesearchaeota archaeon]|nr:MAG: NAD-dependent dehydratase [Candidatus Woesearchaeota archaeon]
MKKVLITGGAGFIGSHMSRNLLEKGYEVTSLDNFYTGNKRNISDLIGNPNFTFLMHDVTIPFDGYFDEIYNLACPASSLHYQRDPIKTSKSSVLGILNVMDLATKTNAKVLHASTSEIYGDPLEHPQTERYWGNVNILGPRSCYDESKRMAETFCSDYFHHHGLDVRVIRIFNTFGPNIEKNDGRVISNFINQALSGEDITLYGDGMQTRSFQYVDDLIEGINGYMGLDQGSLNNSLKNEGWFNIPVLNLGNPSEISIKSLAEKILDLIPDSNSDIIFNGLPKDDPKKRRPDITLAQKILNWNPKISLEEGLQKTIQYFKEFN